MTIILIFEAVLIKIENEEPPAGSDQWLSDALIRFKYASAILCPEISALSNNLHL